MFYTYIWVLGIYHPLFVIAFLYRCMLAIDLTVCICIYTYPMKLFPLYVMMYDSIYYDNSRESNGKDRNGGFVEMRITNAAVFAFFTLWTSTHTHTHSFFYIYLFYVYCRTPYIVTQYIFMPLVYRTSRWCCCRCFYCCFCCCCYHRFYRVCRLPHNYNNIYMRYIHMICYNNTIKYIYTIYYYIPLAITGERAPHTFVSLS